MKNLLLVLLLGANASMAQTLEPQHAPAAGAQSGDTLAEIRRLIGTPACSSNAQCRTLPVGARACGGPDAYLAYSTQQADAGRLQALAERSRSERKAESERSGEMSVCRHVTDPGAVCVAGTCRLSTASTDA